jgi:hypothetical protein
MVQLVAVLAILSTVSATHTGATQTESSIVFHTDFESGVDANFDDWPDQWTRRRDRGYPAYIPIQIVRAERPEVTNNRALQIRLDGGAAQIFSPPFSVRPQFSYLLDVSVRTERLVNDVVSFSVSLYDANDRLLETYESELLHQTDHWKQVRLGPITASSDKIHTAVVSAHVRSDTVPDLAGIVWIDEVRLSRLPKMSVETNSEYNIYTRPKDVHVTCRVSGFTHASPVLNFELLDMRGHQLETCQRTVAPSDETGRPRARGATTAPVTENGFAGVVTWNPQIPDYGFYVLKVSTTEHSGFRKNIVVVPPLARRKSGEFGWSLPDGEHPIGIRVLPNLLAQAGLHWVKFPIWFTSEETTRAEELASFAERLSLNHIDLVGVLDPPPSEGTESSGAKERVAAASIFEDRSSWLPAVEPIMTRLSLKVQWWQLGRDDDTSFSSFPDLDTTIRAIREDLTKFGQKVNVGVPWRTIELPPDVDDPPWAFLSYVEPLPFTDAEMVAYLDTEATSHSKRWVVLQPLDKQHYDLETRGRDLVLQMVTAKTSEAAGIFLSNPFDEECGVMNSSGSPSELFLPWRTAATLLGGCDYLGSLRLPHASQNYVFARDKEGVVVLWNDRPTTETVFLGEDIELFDIWGRQSIPEKRTEDGSVRHVIPVGPNPIFVTGVNPAVARWCMDFDFETTNLANEFGREQAIQYSFTNTFAHGIGGRITIHVPDTWRTDTPGRQFKLAAGEEYHDKIRVILGPEANTGKQSLRVDFDLAGESHLQFSLSRTLEVGLGDVSVELETRLDDHGNLIVEQRLMNNQDEPVSFNCMLFAPGRRRDKRQAFNLNHGQTTNIFVLPNGQELLGKTLWLRAEEIGGVRILNDRIVAHE